jgi:hypothetical protein
LTFCCYANKKSKLSAMAHRNQGKTRLRDKPPAVHREPVLIRREAASDIGVIHAITAAAFARPDQPPARLSGTWYAPEGMSARHPSSRSGR